MDRNVEMFMTIEKSLVQVSFAAMLLWLSMDSRKFQAIFWLIYLTGVNFWWFFLLQALNLNDSKVNTVSFGYAKFQKSLGIKLPDHYT